MRKVLWFGAGVVLAIAGTSVADNISQWNITAASNNSSPPNGAPEGMAPSTVNDVMREIMAAAARWYQDNDDAYDLQGFLPIVPLTKGGTGATTAAAARTNLGLGSIATVASPVPVANGGTAATDAATARTNLGAAATSHSHATSDVTSGTFADARIAASNVTQHQASLGSESATASTIARRNSSGYILATYFNQSSSQSEVATPAQVFVETGSDGYLRKSSLAQLQDDLTTRNITGKAGVTKTLSTSAPSGGSDG